jgi:hypothetical protein
MAKLLDGYVPLGYDQNLCGKFKKLALCCRHPFLVLARAGAELLVLELQ